MVAGQTSVVCLLSGQRCLGDVWLIYGRALLIQIGVWPIYGLFGLSKIWPGALPTGHCPGIDLFIGNQIAMRNTAPGFKSKLKVTWCQPDSQKWPPRRKESRGGPRSKMPLVIKTDFTAWMYYKWCKILYCPSIMFYHKHNCNVNKLNESHTNWSSPIRKRFKKRKPRLIS